MRGRRPTTGLDAAIKMAWMRGDVIPCNDPNRISDFIIQCHGRLVFDRVMRVSRLRCTVEDVESECMDAIRMIRTLPAYGPVIRELWTYSRHGWRHFRIGDAVIERIDKDGNLAPEPEKSPAGVQTRSKGQASIPMADKG